MRLVDLDAPLTDLRLPRSRRGEPYRWLMAVARLEGEPLGVASFPVGSNGQVTRAQLERGVAPMLEHRPPTPDPGRPPEARSRSVSVVVTTCSDPEPLERCLRSILACDYDDFELIVVDNRPASALTRRLLAERFRDLPRIRYVEEPRPGLSRARNAGLVLADGELVAFTDDDVVVDPGWIRRCVEGFERAEDVACVTGLILPLELETDTQLLLEQFAGFGKGFRPQTYRLPESRQAHPLLPYTPGVIGSGANTVVDADVARRLGGFDTALGAGTSAAGGEDLDLYLRLLREGHAIAYEPGAVVWHEHPDGSPRLRRQVYRYGVGLGATIVKQLLTGPERVELLRAVPAGVRYATDPGSRKNEAKGPAFPRALDWLERAGMLVGPGGYLAGALRSAASRWWKRPGSARADGARVEHVIFPDARAIPVVSFRGRSRTSAETVSPAQPGLTRAAAAACVAAFLLVALGLPGALALPAVLAVLCLVPGIALLSVLGGRAELGLVLGVSLAVCAVLAQAMLWLGAWHPKLFLCGLAAVCLPPLVARLDIPWRRWARGAPGPGVFGAPRPPPGVVRAWATMLRARLELRGIPLHVAGHAALLSAATASWGASLAEADLSRIAGTGLLGALPPTYFLAFGLLLIGFVRAATRDRLAPTLLATYVLALIVVVHGTTPLLYDEPRYPWVFKHLSVTSFIAASGGVDRHVDIYNNWPGFFALNAWLSSATGLRPSTYAAWAQVFFNLANVAALRFALRGVTRDERLLWTAAGLFVLANWLGQDYLAPQAFAFMLSLVVVGLCLRCGAPPREPRRLARFILRRPSLDEAAAGCSLSPRAAVVLGGVCYIAVVVSHQLTPVILLVTVAGLALFTRRVPLWVPFAMAVVELWWLALAWPYLSDHYPIFQPNPTASGAPAGYEIGQGLPGLAAVVWSARTAVVLVLGAAAIGLVRRLRAGHWDLGAAIPVAAALVVVTAHSYSGEGRYRFYLFALPWLCMFAAAACASSRRPGTLSRWRLALASGALSVCLLLAYFGLELVNRVSPGDVAAAVWFEDHAPPGALLVQVTSNSISRVTARYARVYDARIPANPNLTDRPAYRGRSLGRRDLPRIAATLRGYGARHVFLILTPGQERFARLYGVLPAGWRQSLERAVRGSPSFRLVYRRGRSSIFEYTGGAPRGPTLADEFRGPAGAPPDKGKWNLETGGGWGRELQAYTDRPANASLDGKGHLAITARKERYTGPDGITSRYTSARLNTHRKLEFQYGRVEARIRVPGGRGLTSAFWALGTNLHQVGWPASGEIDVMEVNGARPRSLFAHLHGPRRGDEQYALGAKRRMGAPLSGAFHVYGVSWSPGRIAFSLDGERYAVRARRQLPSGSRWIFDRPFFLLLTLAVGGEWAGPPDGATRWPATMLVDWVRVWERPGAAG